MGLKTSYLKWSSNKLQPRSYVREEIFFFFPKLREEFFFFSNLKISDKRKERRKECVAREAGYISWDTLRK